MTHSISRKLYSRIILLYPQLFREQFGEEMLDVFDECRTAPRRNLSLPTVMLLADGIFAAISQNLQSVAAPLPPRTALYSEVPSSPALARALATAVLIASALVSLISPDTKPHRDVWPTLSIGHRILYFQSASARMPVSKHEQMLP